MPNCGSDAAVRRMVLADQFRRQQRRNLAERDVHGDQHDLELRRVKQHGHVSGAAQVREQVGVALPRQARPARTPAC